MLLITLKTLHQLFTYWQVKQEMKETLNALKLNVTKELTALKEEALVIVKDLPIGLFHKVRKLISILLLPLRQLSLNSTS